MQALQLIKYHKQNPKIALRQIEPSALQDGQVLIKVHTASLNPVDMKLTEGFSFALQKPPFTLGVDGAGIIEQMAADVANFKIGDAVFFYTTFTETGSWSDYLVINVHYIAHKPQSMSLRAAGAVALVGLTAFTAMQKLCIQPKQRILIHGVAGGVGLMAAQIAKAQGAYVIGTARQAQAELLKSYGVDQTIDYRQDDFTKLLSNIDGALDTVHDNGKTTGKTLSVMKRGGRVVSLAIPNFKDMHHLNVSLAPPLKCLLTLMNRKFFKQAQKLGITLMPQATYPNQSQMQRLSNFIDQHALQIPIHSVFTLAAYAEAIQALKQPKALGKVVFQMVNAN